MPTHLVVSEDTHKRLKSYTDSHDKKLNRFADYLLRQAILQLEMGIVPVLREAPEKKEGVAE